MAQCHQWTLLYSHLYHQLILYTPARKTHVYFLSTVFVASIGVRQVKLVANFDHRSLAFHRFLQSLIVKRFSVFFLFCFLGAAVTPLGLRWFWGFCQLVTRGYFNVSLRTAVIGLRPILVEYRYTFFFFSYSMASPAKCNVHFTLLNDLCKLGLLSRSRFALQS